MCCMYTVYSGMQEWVIQIPSIPILVSVLFPSLHLKYFRIKFLLLVGCTYVCLVYIFVLHTYVPACIHYTALMDRTCAQCLRMRSSIELSSVILLIVFSVATFFDKMVVKCQSCLHPCGNHTHTGPSSRI